MVSTAPSLLWIHQCTFGPNLSHPMAYACLPRRHLAPTVGLIKALVGVHPDGIFFICSGLNISTASEHCRSSSASRADINSPRPAYGCPGSTSASPDRRSTSSGQHILCPGRHILCPGRHIYVPANICGARVDSGTSLANICVFWLAFPFVGRHRQVLAFSGRDTKVLGRNHALPARPARVMSRLGCHRLSNPSWVGVPSNPSWADAGWIPTGPARGGSSARPIAPLPAGLLGSSSTPARPARVVLAGPPLFDPGLGQRLDPRCGPAVVASAEQPRPVFIRPDHLGLSQRSAYFG
jgi:hypothetical protein